MKFIKFLILLFVIFYKLNANPNAGIVNQNGNDCFMNASIQALSHATPFFAFAEKYQEDFKNKESQSVFFGFMENLKKKSGQTLSGNEINSSSRNFRNYWTKTEGMKHLANGQQDAGEFILGVMNLILKKTTFEDNIKTILNRLVFDKISQALANIRQDSPSEVLSKFISDESSVFEKNKPKKSIKKMTIDDAIEDYKINLLTAIGEAVCKIDPQEKMFECFSAMFFEIFYQNPYKFKDEFLYEIQKKSKSKTLSNYLSEGIGNLLNIRVNEILNAKTYRQSIVINGTSFVGNPKAKYISMEFNSDRDGNDLGSRLLISCMLGNLSDFLQETFAPDKEFWNDESFKKNLEIIKNLFSIFYLIKSEESECLQCHSKTLKNSTYTITNLNIPENENELHTLSECLKNFFSTENLTYKCDHCNKDTNQAKQYKIEELPEMLILQFARFQYHDLASKDSTLITFPEWIEITKPEDPNALTLKEYLSQALLEKIGNKDIRYKLVSFIVHCGGISGGHYWAYGNDENVWYEYNDHIVKPVNDSISSILACGAAYNNATPYILFYKQTSKPLVETTQQPQKPSVPVTAKPKKQVKKQPTTPMVTSYKYETHIQLQPTKVSAPDPKKKKQKSPPTHTEVWKSRFKSIWAALGRGAGKINQGVRMQAYRIKVLVRTILQRLRES